MHFLDKSCAYFREGGEGREGREGKGNSILNDTMFSYTHDGLFGCYIWIPFFLSLIVCVVLGRVFGCC